MKLKDILRRLFRRRKHEKSAKSVPRYQPGSTTIFENEVKYTDYASLSFLQKELFDLEIYKFDCDKASPYIIDAGANIGLSVIYFKRLYPKSRIVAFEPDQGAFDALSFNIKPYGTSNDIQLIKRALWDTEGTLQFYAEGADGGRLATNGETSLLVEVPTVSLRPYLKEPVNFLKMDIEGAETRVLRDCADLLSNVERLFVEYHSFTEGDQELHELLGILNQAGFRYYVSHIGVESPHPFTHKNEYLGMDNQLNIYASRI